MVRISLIGFQFFDSQFRERLILDILAWAAAPATLCPRISDRRWMDGWFTIQIDMESVEYWIKINSE